MELLILFALVLLNGFFSMSEIAVVSARRSRLEASAKKGDRKARKALELADNPNRFLSTVQIGITLVGILTGVYSGDKISIQLNEVISQVELLHPYSEVLSVVLVVVFITYLSLVFGELIPKRIGLGNAERIARVVARPMNILSIATAPFIWLLTISSDMFIKIFRLHTVKDEQVTEEEIKGIVKEGMESGSIEEIEHNIVERVFHLGDRNVGSLMTPSVDLVWLDINDSTEVNKEIIVRTGHSVFPVCENNLDHVIGFVTVKELLKAQFVSGQFNLRSMLSDALYVHENLEAYQLLERFKENSKHFALVTDEYGNIAGAITLNDLMDVLLGSISDIQDYENEIVEREDGSYLIDAAISIYDFSHFFHIENKEFTESDEYHSLGGFVLLHARAIPKAGFKFKWKKFEFEVMDMDGNRVDKVLVKKLVSDGE